MGQRIWAVLEQYAGSWVALDKDGVVIDHAQSLDELTRRSPGLTFVFASR